ncbi:MAG: DNA pilot protein [Microviridae sp.]|nr:MAG: DNA pilot protein [Microviridae sp.]
MFGIDDIIGAGIGAWSQDRTNEANAEIARQNNTFNSAQAAVTMNWQKMMSDTAHQREVADLKAAGINPMVTAMGGTGASTPSGATAAATGNPKMENAIGVGMSTALQSARLRQDLKNAQADIILKSAQGLSEAAKASMMTASAKQANEETFQLAKKRGKTQAESDRDESQALWEKANQSTLNILKMAGQGSNIFHNVTGGVGNILKGVPGFKGWMEEGKALGRPRWTPSRGTPTDFMKQWPSP